MATTLQALSGDGVQHPVLRKASGDSKVRAELVLGLEITNRVRAEFITITPEMAAALLLLMPRQRQVYRSVVNKYVSELREGAWSLSDQGVSFDENGRLINGQHRLIACVESGCDLRTLAVFGLPATTFEVIDRGKRRSVADDVHVRGLAEGKFAKTLAAAALIIDRIDRGYAPRVSMINFKPLPTGIRMVDATRSRHPLLTATNELLTTERYVLPRPPMGAFVAFITMMREVDDTLALAFANQILTGEALRQGDPASMIRASLVKGATTLTGVSTSRDAFAYRIVRAWNALRGGRKLNKMLYGSSFKGTGFPKISGYQPKPPVI